MYKRKEKNNWVPLYKQGGHKQNLKTKSSERTVREITKKKTLCTLKMEASVLQSAAPLASPTY